MPKGKHSLSGMVEAAEIVSLVCFEAQLAEESHVPVPQRQAGRGGRGVDGQEPWVHGSMGAGTRGRLLAKAAVGAGGPFLAGWAV